MVRASGNVAAETVTGATINMVNGVHDPAREIEQRGELHDVVGEQRRREVDRQPVPGRIADGQEHVHPRRNGDDDEARPHRQVEPQPISKPR